MARPTKDGLDYFPLNTTNDDKFDLIEARHGLIGFAIIVKLYQKIYDEKGYFYPWGDRQKLLFSRAISTPIETINEVVTSAVEFGIFDSSRYLAGILTSRGIQRRYFEASKKRKVVNLYSDVLLIIPELTDKQSTCNGVFTGINPHTSVLNDGNNPQSKEESKEESSGGKTELIPEITPTEQLETTTTFSVSKLQEEVKTSTGYLIDEKIASQFLNSQIPEEWFSGTDSFFAYAKTVIREKYPEKPENEQRTLFIKAVTSWENLRVEYPSWKLKHEKKAITDSVKQAKQNKPTHCDCGGEIKDVTGRLICSTCKGAWEFSGDRYTRIELNPDAHIDMKSIRQKDTRKDAVTASKSEKPITIPDF